MAHEIKLLHPFQKQALALLQSPVHLVCVSPTGSGKSLIYERVAATYRYRSILISPLIALARQQQKRLQDLGLDTFISAGPLAQSSEAPASPSGVWILSPEKLLNPSVMNAIRIWRPQFLIVDECHCLWEWGSHFRPAFKKIPELLQITSIERSLWLTATLPLQARRELLAVLPLNQSELGAFSLPKSLSLSVQKVPWRDRAAKLISWVGEQKSSGIIFVQSRAHSHRLALLLGATGLRCAVYHAGLAHEERSLTEKKIGAQQPDVVIATSAFGMGMNHSHLRWSLLWQAPPSLLSLAQAIGRAGRDSQRASRALIYWAEEDFLLLDWITRNSERHRSELIEVQKFLSHEGCRTSRLQKYFEGHSQIRRCHQCDYCHSEFEIRLPV